MATISEMTTHIETIAQLRSALKDGAWRLRMFIDAFATDERWRDAQEANTRLLGIAKMMETSAHQNGQPVVMQPVSKSAAKKRWDITTPDSKPHAYKRKYVSQDENEATSKTQISYHTVKRLQSRIGWYVDYVELEYANGTFERHGNPEGGHETTSNTLNDGETIIAVVQQGWSHGHLGSALIFKLSTGREIKINGSSGQKRIKEHKEFSVSSGTQITSLLFEHGILVKVSAHL